MNRLRRTRRSAIWKRKRRLRRLVALRCMTEQEAQQILAAYIRRWEK